MAPACTQRRIMALAPLLAPVLAAGSVSRLLPEDLGLDQFKWTGSALAANGKVYSAPYGDAGRGGSVLVVDPATESSYLQDTLYGGEALWYASTAFGTRVYAAPYSAERVIVIDTETDTSHLQAENYPGLRKWASTAVAPNGRLYAVPYDDADRVLVVAPETDTSYLLEHRGQSSSC